MEIDESERERLSEEKSYDIYRHDYCMDSMDFFYDKCLNSLTNVIEMSWNCEWMQHQFSELKTTCSKLKKQLKIAKLTEDGLNEWKEDLIGAYSKFKDYRYMAENKGNESEVQLYKRVINELDIFRKIIKEMLRILNPEEKEYKKWYAWLDREKFLREIGFLDENNERQHGGQDVKTLLDKMHQYVVRTDEMSTKVYNAQRNILFYNFRTCIGCDHILSMDYDLDETFKEKCYFEEKYLRTVAHDADDKCTDFELPDTKSYNVNVTWPDGRIEKWKLSFFVHEDGNQKGQFEEFPEGQKFLFQFIYKEIIEYAKS
jgi:hypothetical protein